MMTPKNFLVENEREWKQNISLTKSVVIFGNEKSFTNLALD